MKKVGRAVGICLALLVSCALVTTAIAQGSKIDINALVQETQKMSQGAGELSLIWWIPDEFWQASFAQDPTVTPAQAEEFLKIVRPYTIIVAVDGKIGPFGGVTYKTQDQIRSSLQFVDGKGNVYRPYQDAQLDADITSFLSMMKPVLENMLGPLGQNMHFFVFSGKDKDGNRLADPKSEGTFTVKLGGGREFKWRLPLGSLLPPKVCPKCKEKLSGAYKYCPYDGTKLPEGK